MVQQVKVHDIEEMQDRPGVLPEPTNLLEEFNSSFESYGDRRVLPALSYKMGRGECNYMEAVKVSEVLVCFRRAHENASLLAPVNRYGNGEACTTAAAPLSHCYIFAHQVDDVVAALENRN